MTSREEALHRIAQHQELSPLVRMIEEAIPTDEDWSRRYEGKIRVSLVNTKFTKEHIALVMDSYRRLGWDVNLHRSRGGDDYTNYYWYEVITLK